MDDQVQLVKGFYRRPLRVDGKTQAGGGGRVTELMARPFINLFFPELSGIIQPLSGEYAGRRTALEQIVFYSGYGVETGMVIDIFERFGLSAIAQVDLLERIHHNQPLEALSKMSFVILQTVMRKLERRFERPILEEVNRTMKLVRYHARQLLSRCRGGGRIGTPAHDHHTRVQQQQRQEAAHDRALAGAPRTDRLERAGPLPGTGRPAAQRYRAASGGSARRQTLAGRRYAAIYSSDLQRARVTAEIIAGAWAWHVLVDPRLREVNQGAWEGMLVHGDPGSSMQTNGRHAAHDRLHFRPPGGGESVQDVAARLWAAVDDIGRSASRTGPLILVSHGLALATLVCRGQGLPLAQAFDLIPDNAQAHRIEWMPPQERSEE